MIREELIAMIYEDNTIRSCQTEEIKCELEDAEINTQEFCKKCAENLLTEYENKIRADERVKILEAIKILGGISVSQFDGVMMCESETYVKKDTVVALLTK